MRIVQKQNNHGDKERKATGSLNPTEVGDFRRYGRNPCRQEKIRAVKKEAFLKDRDLEGIACYRLLVSSQAALGLCYHVSAKQLKKMPEDYAECFAILSDGRMIPKD